jgi:hypothetical protein
VLGCYSEDLSETLYTIKKGHHDSTPVKLEWLEKNPLRFHAKFDSSAIYSGDGDINKLYGFSDCNSLHHENSARIGWRWSDNQLEIFAYTYAHGIRSYKKIKSVPLDTWVSYSIAAMPDRYRLCVGNECVDMERNTKCNTGMYYILYPYFGGNKRAPHDITIAIR